MKRVCMPKLNRVTFKSLPSTADERKEYSCRLHISTENAVSNTPPSSNAQTQHLSLNKDF